MRISLDDIFFPDLSMFAQILNDFTGLTNIQLWSLRCGIQVFDKHWLNIHNMQRTNNKNYKDFQKFNLYSQIRNCKDTGMDPEKNALSTSSKMPTATGNKKSIGEK